MEAATSADAARKLEGDKAQRIIAAMRASVGKRGAAASTFDHVAREAGVSRGLLHYYFGSKERLLVEVVRHDAAELYRQWRERLAGWLRTKEREGVIRLEADAEAVASILFSLGDGFGIQVLADPEWDQQAAFDLGVATARRLLGEV